MNTLNCFYDIISIYNHLLTTYSFKFKKYSEDVIRKNKEFNTYLQFIEEEKLGDNSIYVSKLKDILTELESYVFQFVPEELLVDLINMFEELFPEETEEIIKFWDTYGFNVSLSKKKILLKGDVQSGKTLMMILTAICYLISGKDVIFILRNKQADKYQLIKRFTDVFERLRDEKKFSHPSFKIVDKKDYPPKNCCIFVDIYSKTNIKKLKRKLVPRNMKNSVLFIDEADCRDDIKDKEFIDLCLSTGTNIFISATVQDILVSNWGINGDTIIPISISQDYRGIDKLNIITERSLTEKDELLWTFCDISIDDEYVDYNRDHPKIVLVNIDRELEQIGNFFNKFKNNDFTEDGIQFKLPSSMTNLCVIEYTGKGIKIFHDEIRFENLKNLSPKIKYESGNFILQKTVSIGDVLLWMARNGGKTVFPNIVIISGDMAGRGINFACYDSLNPINNWHITHQVLIKSDTSSCSNVIQSCRILGRYTDDIPLKLYTTKSIKQKITGGYKLCNELVDVIINENNPLHQEEYKTCGTNESCGKIPIRKSSNPSKFVSRKKIKFNLVGDDEFSIPFMRDEEDEEEDEEYKEERKGVNGWLQYKNKTHEEIYKQIEKILLDRYEKDKWIPRREINSLYLQGRKWDLRNLFQMESKRRNNSNIKFRKINNRVEYKLV